jgi:hypothetical protein
MAELLEFFTAMKGAFKVLNWVGKVAKPLAAIVMLGGACVAFWTAIKGGQADELERKTHCNHRRRCRRPGRAPGAKVRGHRAAQLPRPGGHRHGLHGPHRPELKMGQTYTRQQCEEMLYKDLAKHADA